MTDFELQNLGPRSKLDQRYAISKDVVDPANLGRIRRYGEAEIEQALIETVAGPDRIFDAGPVVRASCTDTSSCDGH